MVPATLSQWSRHGPWFAIFLRDASNQGPFLFPTRQGGKQLPGSLYILLDQPNSPNRLRALKEAATAPKIYSDILGKWPAHELPSDQTIRFYLLRDKGFNDSAVSAFLKDFRASLSFANLDNPTTIEDEGPAKNLSSPPDEPGAASVKDEQMREATQEIPAVVTSKAVVPSISGHKQDTFSLDEGQVILQFPEKMSDASYEDFKDWIELQLRKIKRSIH